MATQRLLSLEDVWALPESSVQTYLISKKYSLGGSLVDRLTATILLSNDRFLQPKDHTSVAD